MTARQVAEAYGLRVSRTGMACCPFHDDKHPSMKIDKNFYCFGCGEKGDAVGYVARMYGISQYQAALKIIDEFHLPIAGKKYQPKQQISQKKLQEQKRICDIKERFQAWCMETIELLKEAVWGIYEVEDSYKGYPVEDCFHEDFVYLMQHKSRLEYWLDILCLGEEQEKQELFLKERKEVRSIAERSKTGRTRLLTSDWRNFGYGDANCG